MNVKRDLVNDMEWEIERKEQGPKNNEKDKLNPSKDLPL